MHKKVLTILIALTVALGIGLINPAPAAASHSGPYFINNLGLGREQMADCEYHDSENRVIGSYVVNIADGNTSPKGCWWLAVYHNRNYQYRSLATGTYYWTGCGRNNTYNPDFPSGYYAHKIGNPVRWGTSVKAC